LEAPPAAAVGLPEQSGPSDPSVESRLARVTEALRAREAAQPIEIDAATMLAAVFLNSAPSFRNYVSGWRNNYPYWVNHGTFYNSGVHFLNNVPSFRNYTSGWRNNINGWANGGGFRNGGFANGGGGAFRNGGFANGNGFHNGGFVNR
jgi:uncharacterized membrane protein YgcG